MIFTFNSKFFHLISYIIKLNDQNKLQYVGFMGTSENMRLRLTVKYARQLTTIDFII